MPKKLHHWINGQKVQVSSGRSGEVFNPATGEVSSIVPFADDAQVGVAVELYHLGRLHRPSSGQG